MDLNLCSPTSGPKQLEETFSCFSSIDFSLTFSCLQPEGASNSDWPPNVKHNVNSLRDVLRFLWVFPWVLTPLQERFTQNGNPLAVPFYMPYSSWKKTIVLSVCCKEFNVYHLIILIQWSCSLSLSIYITICSRGESYSPPRGQHVFFPGCQIYLYSWSNGKGLVPLSK